MYHKIFPKYERDSVFKHLIFSVLILTIFLPSFALAQDDGDSASNVINYIIANTDDVGFACYPVDDPDAGVYLNPDEAFLLASTFKIVILAEYARQVVAGDLDPQERISTDAVEQYYLANTDGGAHPAWLEDTEIDADNTIALSDVPRGMITFSSNAATDYLMARLAENADYGALYELVGMENTRLPQSIIGLFLILVNPEDGVVDLETLTQETQRSRALVQEDQFVSDADYRDSTSEFVLGNLPPVTTQTEFFATYGNAGSARDFTHLMNAIFTGELFGADESVIMREYLEWAMEFPGIQQLFDAFGTKGGSLPGILTSAYFVQPVEGDPVIFSLFFRNLPLDIHQAWSQTFDQQNFELVIALNGCDAFSEAIG